MEADKNNQNPPEDTTGSSLEGAEADSLESVIDATGDKSEGSAAGAKPPKKGFKQKISKFNLYLLLFVFILVIAGAIIGIAYFQAQKASTAATLQTTTLTQNTLQQVANTDATVGGNQQVLNVQSSAVFAGKVLVRDGLEVAGSLQIGGTVALSNLTVSGTSSLGQVEVNRNLAVSGDTGIQGALSVSKSLQVNSTATFSGAISSPQVTTSSLNLNSDLVLTHHIVAGGPTPGRSTGTALGSGGTASVSGSDTAGSLSINIGSGAPAGCFITVNFTQKYNSTPHVLVTPVGSAAATIDYYINRGTTSFSLCTASPAPVGASFNFDYFVIN